ncbi:MAG: TetR/AcrR family transcriptional regulator [Sporolactobacillus sp.]
MSNLDNFLKLPKEKQEKIIDGSLKAFGRSGYKKTSTADIAAEAGISKAMVFHYFGTKKKLYFYLIQLCGDLFMNQINDHRDPQETDFFDRIRRAGDLKIQVMKQQPSILPFLKSMFLETDEEVKAEINALFATGQKAERFRQRIVFEGMDDSKFVEEVDPQLIYKMLIWMSEGFANHLTGDIDNLESFYKDFIDCLNLLKKAFYK